MAKLVISYHDTSHGTTGINFEEMQEPVCCEELLDRFLRFAEIVGFKKYSILKAMAKIIDKEKEIKEE